MKKSALTASSMVLLCCLLALQTTLVSAFSEGDWTYDNEWSDTDTPPLLPDACERVKNYI